MRAADFLLAAHGEPVRTKMTIAISVIEAARRLSLGKSTVYRLAKAGKVRFVKIGGRTLVPVAELDRIITDAAPRRAA